MGSILHKLRWLVGAVVSFSIYLTRGCAYTTSQSQSSFFVASLCSLLFLAPFSLFVLNIASVYDPGAGSMKM